MPGKTKGWAPARAGGLRVSPGHAGRVCALVLMNEAAGTSPTYALDLSTCQSLCHRSLAISGQSTGPSYRHF